MLKHLFRISCGILVRMRVLVRAWGPYFYAASVALLGLGLQAYFVFNSFLLAIVLWVLSGMSFLLSFCLFVWGFREARYRDKLERP